MTDSPEDDRLRALLEDAVSDVDPPPALHRIQSRTKKPEPRPKVTPMSSRRPWIYAALGAVAATAATLVAVTALADDEPADTAGPASSPSSTPTSEPSPTEPSDPSPSPSRSADPQLQALPVYYVADTNTGPRLFREFHRLEAEPVPAGQVRIALTEAFSDTALDPDYRSGWPEGTVVTGVTVDGVETADVVSVDLSSDAGSLHDRPADMSEAEAQLAVEQLIHTTQAVLQQRAPVQLLLDGERTDTVLGVPTAEPLAEGDPMAVQGTVWITSPQDGDSVGSTFAVTGRGAFFEANVSWQLLRGSTVVKEGFSTAEQGNVLSSYRFTVKNVPAGDYVLRVYDADMSGGEGNGESEDTKRITVTG